MAVAYHPVLLFALPFVLSPSLLAVAACDVLMLLRAVPLLGPACLDDRALAGNDEFKMMLQSYEATRKVAEVLLESVPQLVLQLWMVLGSHDTAGLDLDSEGALYRALVASLVNLVFVVATNVWAMRRQGLGVRAYAKMLVQIGGGKVGNIIKRIARDDPGFAGRVDLSHSGVTDAHARMLAAALKTNTRVTQLILGGN